MARQRVAKPLTRREKRQQEDRAAAEAIAPTARVTAAQVRATLDTLRRNQRDIPERFTASHAAIARLIERCEARLAAMGR